MRVESSLHGLRYLMRRWFYTFAFFAISGMTAGIFFSVLSAAVVLQANAKMLIEKIQTQREPYHVRVPKRRRQIH